MRPGRTGQRGGGAGGGAGKNGGGGDGGALESDSFVQRISDWFMTWKVRPDVVLRGRHENKSKGALSAFWQDYKKVRVDWRARAGMRRDHFELALQHYMRIDGPSRDTCEGRIRYIWETRIRDNSHLGVVDVSCQPAKAKIGKRKTSLLAPQQKDEDVSSHISQQQQHFQRSQYMQNESTGVFPFSGLQHQTAPASGSSRLFSDPDNGGGGNGNPNGLAAPGGVGPGSPGITGPYDGNGDGTATGAPTSRSNQEAVAMGFAQGGGTHSGSGQRVDRRGYGEQGMGGRMGGALDAPQGRGINVALGVGAVASVVKGEVQRAGRSGEEDSVKKRPRETWSGLGDPVGSGATTASGSSIGIRGSGRASPSALSASSSGGGGGASAGGLLTAGAGNGNKKDRVPNHWWELELTVEGPMLYPTSNCHEWTSDNGIEHRIMEIEFQHGCEVKPPKDRLIKDFTLNWRPNSDIVYVFETEPSGYYGPILGMYEKQTVTHNKMFLYRQMQAQPWPSRERGWNGGGGGETQMRAAWLFNDPLSGQWTVALDYQAQPCSPIYQYNVPPECVRTGTPCMELNTFNANSIKVKGCTTLIPPTEVLLLSENSVRDICGAVWVGCFTANPSEVAFDLLCRLMSMSESLHLPDDSDRYAAEVFDAQRSEILAFFLVAICEDPADRVVQREHYLAFMEWFVYTLPEVALPVKIWRLYRALNDDNIPFVSFPLSQDKSAFYSHRQAMSGPAIPGRFSFRFSRQPSCVTVDYTVQATAVEGRAQATVMSYRIKISSIDIRTVMLRIENLLLRGDGQVAEGRMLEETSLVQGPAAENGARGGTNGINGTHGANSTNGVSGGGGGQGTAGPAGGAVANGVVGLRDGSWSLERVIAQVNMEERQEIPRPAPVDSAGGGGGGAAGGGGGADGSGWTDMFQGMTVELAQAQAAQLPGDGSLSHLQNPAAAALGVLQNQKRHDGGTGGNHSRDARQHPHHPSHQGQHGGRGGGGGGDHHRAHQAGQQHHQQQHERRQRSDHRMEEHGHQGGQQRSRVGGGPAGGDGDRRGGAQQQQQHHPFTQQGEGQAPFMYGPGGGRLTVHTGETLSFFDDPPQGNHVQGPGGGGAGHGAAGSGGMMNLEFVEFSSFHELLVFFGRTLTERYDTTKEEQETIPSPMYMHNMDD